MFVFSSPFVCAKRGECILTAKVAILHSVYVYIMLCLVPNLPNTFVLHLLMTKTTKSFQLCFFPKEFYLENRLKICITISFLDHLIVQLCNYNHQNKVIHMDI